MSVVPAQLRYATHRLPAVLPLLRPDRGTGKLEVRELDVLPFDHALADLDIVGRDLVAEAPRPRMDHDADRSDVADSHGFRCTLVEDPIDLLDRSEERRVGKECRCRW